MSRMGLCRLRILHFLVLVIVFFQSVMSADENARIFNERAALLSFMTGVISDPKHALESWNSSNVHVCKWTGIKCNSKGDQVLELDLHDKSLGGTISPIISSLSNLEVLDLSGNIFEGQIPAELGYLFNLRQLSLSSNLLERRIPAELGFLRELVYLDLGGNKLIGEIPMTLFCNGTSSLEYVDLSNNSISGKIPLEQHCELRELRFLLLWSNQLVGQVPHALSNSSKLEWIDLESNFLSGELPFEILSKMPKLQFLYLSYNHFSSHKGNTDLTPFFSSLANSSNLQELELAGNDLGGEIPSIIGNLSMNLLQIHLDDNLIFGPIPANISNLVNLTLLNLSSNLLNGSVPPELCRMGKLERLYLSNNSLSGAIPLTFGEVPHLGLLDLSKNKLSGPIPDSFANLAQLRRLLLYENQLSGTIPPSLGKCINLEILDLSHNRISGVIPCEVAGLSSLKLYLNLSRNQLHGPIPLDLSKMDMVLAIDISSNNLSGTIPSQLASCIALEHLDVSNNSLIGSLPKSLGHMPYLKGLDVSLNQLTGEIPQSLQASSTLKQLNFSFNNFSGNISSKGAFSLLSVDSFLGNPGLCGSIKGMTTCKKKRNHHFIELSLLLSLFAMLTLFLSVIPMVLKAKFKRKRAILRSKDMDMVDEEQQRKEAKYPKITHQQLVEATGGFCSSSLIGSGRFGHVYKGTLQDNTRIAVKVIDSKTGGPISGSFKRECQVLKRTRHRNLIRIVTICSRPDFKALVLPLMPNGSLESHLYPSHGLNHRLNLIQVVSICSDVAEGLAYLHHYSPVKVVHCDLKPSNILLDDDMTALVTDFGIARLVKEDDENIPANDSASFNSTDGLLCGSLGYIAPEYGMGRQASTPGDVFSFGVLLLEIVTGKRPTDVLFHQGSSLHEWIKSHYPHKLQPILQEALNRLAPHSPALECHSKLWQDMIVELIELGMICTQGNPSARPTMLVVTHEMTRWKEYLSSSPSSRLVEETSNKSSSTFSS